MNRVLVVTGAGISAESGIPTFRGKDGYWRNLDPTKLATEAAFRADPALVWEWYRERRELIRRSQPNPAHASLVHLAQHVPAFLVLTQNVDDLHLRAQWQGHHLRAEQIVQIHGDIFVDRCSRCDFATRDTDGTGDGVPVCPACGSLMRPGVVWFDEELDRSEVARVERFLAEGPADVVLVIGTTASFDYVVEWANRGRGPTGRLIEINPDQTPISAIASEVVRAPAAQALPPIVNQLTGPPR